MKKTLLNILIFLIAFVVSVVRIPYLMAATFILLMDKWYLWVKVNLKEFMNG